jgi:glutamine synthetase
MKIKLEYVWLDGYEPEPNLRSKVKVIETNIKDLKITDIPLWNFDGSSTQQAEGNNSDCILKPVKIYKSNGNPSTIYVMCEVLNSDNTPHVTNHRAKILENSSYKPDMWFGFEQEYFFREGKNSPILGHMSNNEPQGKFYCGVGSNVVGRNIVEEHLDLCLDYDIFITGTNAEVALGQWEYQVFSKDVLDAGDDLWMTRYFLNKVSEKYGVYVEYHPKPLRTGEWNGSGLHTNFSTKKMREEGGEEYFNAIFRAFEMRHENHIEVYGSENDLRLTGKFETQSINKFSWGVADRGASIRVPHSTKENWKGYLEDRRPASNANPYDIIRVISVTLDMTEELFSLHHNMYSNVSLKNIDEVIKKYQAVSSDDLLDEYKND